MLNYTSNASNTPNNCRLFADLNITSYPTTGPPTTQKIEINSYLGDIPGGVYQRKIYGPFTWTMWPTTGVDKNIGRLENWW